MAQQRAGSAPAHFPWNASPRRQEHFPHGVHIFTALCAFGVSLHKQNVSQGITAHMHKKCSEDMGYVCFLHVCVCACVHVCVRACVCACTCMHACEIMGMSYRSIDQFSHIWVSSKALFQNNYGLFLCDVLHHSADLCTPGLFSPLTGLCHKPSR